jgi:hypothetical protein
VDAGADDGSARCRHAESSGDELAGRCEDDRGAKLLRRHGVASAGPVGAELAREALPGLVGRTRERECAAALVAGDLEHDVCGGSEAVQAERVSVACEAKRAVADQPGAEERRRLLVPIAVWDREAEALVRDGVLGEAAVQVVAGEASPLAEVLAARTAVAARAARPAEPRNPDAGAALDGGADDLVAEDERELRISQIAVRDVEVGATDAAGTDRHENLPCCRLGLRQLARDERLRRRLEHHRTHGVSLRASDTVSLAVRAARPPSRRFK